MITAGPTVEAYFPPTNLVTALDNSAAISAGELTRMQGFVGGSAFGDQLQAQFGSDLRAAFIAFDESESVPTVTSFSNFQSQINAFERTRSQSQNFVRLFNRIGRIQTSGGNADGNLARQLLLITDGYIVPAELEATRAASAALMAQGYEIYLIQLPDPDGEVTMEMIEALVGSGNASQRAFRNQFGSSFSATALATALIAQLYSDAILAVPAPVPDDPIIPDVPGIPGDGGFSPLDPFPPLLPGVEREKVLKFYKDKFSGAFDWRRYPGWEGGIPGLEGIQGLSVEGNAVGAGHDCYPPSQRASRGGYYGTSGYGCSPDFHHRRRRREGPGRRPQHGPASRGCGYSY